MCVICDLWCLGIKWLLSGRISTTILYMVFMLKRAILFFLVLFILESLYHSMKAEVHLKVDIYCTVLPFLAI